MYKVSEKTLLNRASLHSACSYELDGHNITRRLFGVIPFQSIQLADVLYLRLATYDELFTPTYLLAHWPQLLPHHRFARPVYILKTKAGRCIFLKLEPGAHFRLRQAIGDQQQQQHRIAA